MKTKSSDSRLVFRDLEVTAKNKKILNGISGEARSGELLAVMGPTGSGKTTLLNSIAGRLPLSSGEITLNGRQYTKLLRRKLAYVLQTDIFLPRLTLWETLYFTAMIRIPESVPKAEKMSRIDEIVDALDIRKCLNTVIGDIFLRGLSGGEKKRANIACELLTDPDIMLIDEPTSGLDSSTAHQLMQQLRNYALHYNKTIITTIHQPSSQVFHMFSSLLLLVEGHTAYFGDGHNALSYFSQIGFTLEKAYNPADFLLELLKSDESDVDKIISAAKNMGKALDVPNGNSLHLSNGSLDVSDPNIHTIGIRKIDSSKCILDAITVDFNVAENEYELPKKQWPTSLWTQFCMLTWRNFKQAKGRIFDPPDAIQAVLISLLAGIIYYQIDQELYTFRDRMGVIFFCLVYWGFNMMQMTIAGFPGERGVVNKERRAGAYRLSAYYMAKIFSELPLILIVPLFFFCVVYWMAGLGSVTDFFIYLGVNLLSCLVTQSIGHIIGASIIDIKAGIITANTVMLFSLLLGGFFNTHFPSWLFWGKYLSMIHYPYATMVTIILGDIPPIWCNSTTIDLYPRCANNATEIVTAKDFLQEVGIELPIHCYISTMAILLVVFKVMGYYTLKWKKA